MESCTEPAVPALEASGISMRFGSATVLDSVDLSVAAGEVHGLVGRNGAGKSTLVAILSGVLSPLAGAVRFGGAPAPRPGHVRQWRRHIGTVYQKPMIISELSVLENLFLGAPVVRTGGFVRWPTMRETAAATLAGWGIDIDLDVEAGKLSIGQRQLLETLRIMLLGPKVIILDEPTAKLERSEAALLLEHINQLRLTGVSFIYVSHHLGEVLDACNTITVLRNGRKVFTRPAGEATAAQLSEAMSGQAVIDTGMIGRSRARTGEAENSGCDAALSVADLKTGSTVSGVSFSLEPGECVGLAGLRGSGNQEVGMALAGLVPSASGQVEVEGKRLDLRSARRTLNAGIGYLPGDRHTDGFVPEMSLTDNVTMSVLPRLTRFGFVRRRHRNRLVSELAGRLGIVASSVSQAVGELSGGNQQKVVMGRAIASDPRVLVLDNPTAGVDVASREALFGVVGKACAAGTAVLLVSDDAEELRRCSRILVMVRGRISAALDGGCSESEIVTAMSGGKR